MSHESALSCKAARKHGSATQPPPFRRARGTKGFVLRSQLPPSSAPSLKEESDHMRRFVEWVVKSWTYIIETTRGFAPATSRWTIHPLLKAINSEPSFCMNDIILMLIRKKQSTASSLRGKKRNCGKCTGTCSSACFLWGCPRYKSFITRVQGMNDTTPITKPAQSSVRRRKKTLHKT